MKYQLIKEINPNYSAIEQVLTNRGIPYSEIKHYLNTTDNDINSAEMLGEERLKAAATALLTTIKENKKMLVVVDSDCDGYTSSALLLNYLYDLFPAFIQNNTKYYIHNGKEHGLSDVMEYIFEKDFELIILPHFFPYSTRLRVSLCLEPISPSLGALPLRVPKIPFAVISQEIS